jgi:hypothetical protein
MTNREAFDLADIRDVFGQVPTYRERELAWFAWQAATAATQERCAQAVEELDRKKWFPSQRDFVLACVDAIRKG